MSRRWMVTGGSRGLGRATVRQALQNGDRVAVIARHIDATAFADEADRLLCIEADVTDAGSMDAAARRVAGEWGGIDVLINNAGLHRGGKIDRLPLVEWDAVLATNLSGPLHCIRAVLPHMGSGGAIVNVGAVIGLRGFAGDAAYGASKAGLTGLTATLAVELAARQIRVNLVIPGFVPTDMTAKIAAKARERMLARIPLRRMGTDEEIAQVIWWVSGSTYMTGATVATDGGLLCQM